MIHTIDKTRKFGGKSQRINSPASMRKAEDYVKKEQAVNTETGEIVEKTNRELWYSSTGVVDDFARQCMSLQKQQGYVFKEGDKRLMVHQIQSFDARDVVKNGGNLTPEIAHKIGVELVKNTYPNYQVLVVTHYNTAHIHNHILINGVASPVQNQDGTFQKPHKFQDGNNAHRYENEYSLAEVKLKDKELCKQYALEFSSQCYKNQKKEFDFKQNKSSVSPTLESYKRKIDQAIEMCKHFDFKEFRNILNKSFGINTKVDNSRNSITYKANPEEKIKKVSGRKLGQGYRLEDINERLRSLKATASVGKRNSNGSNADASMQDIRTELEDRRTKVSVGSVESGKQNPYRKESRTWQTVNGNGVKSRKI